MEKKKYIYLGGGLDPIVLTILNPILEGYKNEEGIIIAQGDFQLFQEYLNKKKKKFQKFSALDEILVDYYKFNLKYFLLFILNLLKNFYFYMKLLFFFPTEIKKITVQRFRIVIGILALEILMIIN